MFFLFVSWRCYCGFFVCLFYSFVLYKFGCVVFFGLLLIFKGVRFSCKTKIVMYSYAHLHVVFDLTLYSYSWIIHYFYLHYLLVN